MTISILYPSATNINLIPEFGKELWSWGKPLGVTLHYASDRDSKRVINWLKQEKLGYHIIIERDGTVVQTCSFDKRVDHAGAATWKNLSPNRHHIAICVMSWGKLLANKEKYFNWTGHEIDFNDVAIRANFKGVSGYWDKATQKQEISLMVLLNWLVNSGIEPSNICGHDESCLPQGRKQDPGGVLSLSSDAIRKQLAIKP